MSPKQIFKSKTINFNLLVPAIAGLLAAFGVAVPSEVVIGIIAIGNFILRLITSVPISDK